jgi:hypothetical protein
MNSRWLLTGFFVFVIGLVLLALPHPAMAAMEVSGDFGYFDEGNTSTSSGGLQISMDGGTKIAIPGILSLLVAPGGGGQAGALNLGSMEVDLPTLNATAKVDGLTVGLNEFGWDTVTVSQVEPKYGDTMTLSGLQATVRGPATGYSSDLTAHVALHPNEAVQAEGTVGVIYDGLNRSAGVGISDGQVSVNAGPMQIEATGINSAQGGLTVDSAQIGVPSTGATTTLSGFRVVGGQPDWDALMVARDEVKLGNVATLSGLQASVQGASTGYSTDLTAHLALHPNEAVQAEGTVGVIRDGLTGSTGVGISDGQVSVNAGPVQIEATGINSTQGGLTTESAQIGVPATGATTTLTGFQVIDGQPDWDALTLTRDDIKLGNVATLSNLQVNVLGPSAGYKTEASVNLGVQLGQLAQANGQLVSVHDPSMGGFQTALHDGSVSFDAGILNATLTGVNYQDSTVTIDNAAIGLQPLGLEGEVNGITLGASGGMGFSEARIKYAPASTTAGPVGGFEVVVTQADGGYVMTTTSTVSIPAGK